MFHVSIHVSASPFALSHHITYQTIYLFHCRKLIGQKKIVLLHYRIGSAWLEVSQYTEVGLGAEGRIVEQEGARAQGLLA